MKKNVKNLELTELVIKELEFSFVTSVKALARTRELLDFLGNHNEARQIDDLIASLERIDSSRTTS